MKAYARGIVIGKFCPPHIGHNYLIDTESSRCEQLSVLVCWKHEQAVPIDVRMSCIRERHPEVNVIAVEDKLSDDDTLGWAANTVMILGYAPDVVFSSEDYGERYARAMGAEHVMVDRNRIKFPCSGTMLRSNPLESLEWLAPCVRAYYIKRICIVGAESTGKTTLAELLARHYKTSWVPEYGREYCELKWQDGLITDDWESTEFLAIAEEQAKREDELAKKANRVLICDTDPFATSIWHERYMGFRHPELISLADRRKYDLYLLAGDEIPFVQDGLRDGEHIRHWMHGRFTDELNASGRHWVLLRGSTEERLASAVGLIDEILRRCHSRKR